jgi:hypothetical protein
MNNQKYEYVVGTGEEEYVFSCSVGNEHELMSQLLEMVFDEKLDFDWSDAIEITIGIVDDLVKERESRSFT